MKKRRVFSYAFAGLLSVVLVLAACASPTSTPGGTTTTSGKPSGAQVLRVNIAQEPPQIDPTRASFAQERSIAIQVFEGLLAFNPDLTLKPDVAQDIPSVANKGISADGKTYTFKLKNNVTWSDGKKVTAKDFEYSIKRIFDPDLGVEYEDFYSDISGGQAYFESGKKDDATKRQLRDAIGVKALDDSTLQIQLAQPRPTFLQLMALWPAFPLREDIITKLGEKWTEPPNYVGNGPYLLSEWAHQDHLTFKANPNYWGIKPKITEIQYKIITDANAELAAYRNNELDMARVPTGTEAATLADASVKDQIFRSNDLATFAFQFQVHTPPFDNVKLRQALSCAVDRAAFVNKVTGGVNKVAYSWIPPGMPGYDAQLGKQYEFNVAKAKQLLAEAGYSDVSKLPPLKFQYADTAARRVVAQFLQGQMKDNLGIDIVLEPMEPKAYTNLIKANKETWGWLGWIADYPDPDDWLPGLYGTGAGNNHTTYSNPAFDDLAKKAAAELDNTKRLQLWDQAQKLVTDDAPVITLYYRESLWLIKPWVKGLRTTTTGMDALPGESFYASDSIQK